MIEQIKNIGQYVEETFPEKRVFEAMVNKINSQDMKYVLIANIVNDKVIYETVDFYRDVTKDALFYQAGNGALGGGVRLDFYEQNGELKGRNKLKRACNFCEVEDYYGEIQKYVESYLKDHDKNTFFMIKVNHKTPRELFEKKFLDKMYTTMYKALQGRHQCHLCGTIGKAYNTTTYKFYTNDKDIYGNVNDPEKSGVVIGEECLNRAILAKEYIERYLSTNWVGQKVMFLPHHYDEDVAAIYENTEINEDGKVINLLHKIRINEGLVVEEIGKTKAITDIIFYEDDGKSFEINHTIQSIMPSRFNLLSNLLGKYELRLFVILKYVAAVRVSLNEVETTDKEQMRILDAIFSGKRIDRNLFFKRVMDVYKHYYVNDELKKYYPMKTINEIYNFLCDCKCLEKGWNTLEKYKNYHELFSNNPQYFDTKEKQAWFILGKAYNTMVYYIKKSGKNRSEKEESGEKSNDRTSLEKNFFFARKFNFNDFIYFSNLLTEKALKYNVNTVYFQKMMSEAKELMANRENKLSLDEAKYLFFWGMDSYFVREEKNSEDEEE